MSLMLQLRAEESRRAKSILAHRNAIHDLIDSRKKDIELIARLVDAKQRELAERDDLTPAQRQVIRIDRDDLEQLLAELVNLSATEMLGTGVMVHFVIPKRENGNIK